MKDEYNAKLGVEAKQSIGNQILSRMESLTTQLEEAASTLGEVLIPVSSVSTPCNTESDKVFQEMPPYFHKVRNNLDRIEEVIMSINDSIHRIQL